VPEPLAYRNSHGAKKVGEATALQAASESSDVGGLKAHSDRQIKSSQHDLRDGCFFNSARRSSWRSQIDLRRPMLQNSKYSVWFRTSKGDGYGIVSLMDGEVSGGDDISSYIGTYTQEGDSFSAAIAVRRHTQGPASVFGVDNVDLTLSGKSTPTMASCTGTAKQAPSTTLQATLIRIAD
jgi:hypothetical protein